MRIRWTQPAVHDLTTICDYIAERDNPSAARKVALALYDAINSLQQFPRRGRPGRKSGTRELVVLDSPYLVMYRIHHDRIEVSRVLHGAQRWP